jgi:tape measure domain-containing protein
MAESVARVKVQATADLKGLEDAKKALQDLQKAVGPTDAALAQVRQEIIEFGNVNKRTEAAIQAQVNAFQKLRQQAEVGGKVYNDLGRDIERLKRVANESGAAISKLGQATASAGRQQGGKSFWQRQSEELVAFNRQAGQTGKAVSELAAAFDMKFERAGSAIQEAGREIARLKQNASNIGSLMQGPAKGGGAFEVGRKGLADIQAFSQLVTRLKEQTETATGRVARLSEGLFAAGVAGKGISATVTSLGGVAGAAENVAKFAANLSASFAQMGAGAPQWAGGMKAALNQISLLLNQPANGVANWVSSLNSAQAKLSALNVPLEAFNNALAAIGPEGAAVAGVLAVSFAGLQDAITRAFRAGDKEASQALQSITDETQRLINKLAQLSEAFRGAASMNELQALRAGGAARFNETPAGTDASRRAANTIANAEARIKAEAAAQADVLEQARQRYRGTTESVDALSERLAYLQSAMKLVDQSTTEGKAEFAAFSSEATQVKRQIDALSQSYRTVADAIREATAAQGEYANKGTVSNYLNRAAVRQQEELAAAARTALNQPQVLSLPAAGQTSFSGTYGPSGIGGGARLGTGAKDSPFTIGAEQVGAGVTALYRGAERSEMQIAAAGAALEREFNNASNAINRAEKELNDVQKELNETLRDGLRVAEALTKIDFVNPNSINALKARREQIDRERNSVDMLSKEYKQLSGELAKVDRQIEGTQAGGLRGKVGYIGQGVGAIASAGIFGGPEGAIGGALGGGIGAALGGPAGFAAGSFIGSSIGAYAGMIRQSVAATGEFSAEVKRLEIALQGVTGSAQEFARAQEIIKLAGVELNVPVLEATKGFTQLTAAVKGAGGNVTDAEIVFRGVTEAIKATGGGADEVQASLTAMSQIFSKGKVSAEELQGQLGERLPGAVTLFAEATGRTLPQLQKDLQDGTVGLADVMKFAASLSDKYGEQAAKMAASTEDSTARMKVALDDLRVAFGSIVKPITASIQSVIARLAEMTTRALRAVGLVKDSMSELGAVGRGRDLQARAADAYRTLGSGPQSVSEKRAAFKSASELANAATPQKSLVGVQQNLRTLQQSRDIVRQITAEGLSDVQIKLLQDYGTRLDKRIFSEQQLLDTLKKQREVTDFKAAKTNDDADSKKAAKEAEKRAREEQLLQEAAARARIALDDTVFQNQIELIRKRYDYEEELIRQQREVWAGTFEGIRGDSARSFVDLQNRLNDLRKRTFESDLNVKQAEQELRSATRMEAVTSQGVATTGIVARTGSTGDSTGPHLDLRWGDGRPITKADADKYFLVNGRAPSSFGVTSPYGPRNLFGRSFHSGIDFGTPAGSGLSLKGGATFGRNLGNTGAGGYAIEVMTPQGTMRALHLMAGSVMRTAGGPSGAGAQVRRDVRAEGNLGVASADLGQARAIAGLDRAQVQGLEQLLPQQFAQQQTQGLRDQAKALEDNNALLAKRIQLEAQGMRPELLDAQMRIAELELQRSDKLAQLNENLKTATERQDPTLIAAVRSEIELTNAAYDRQVIAINALAQAQTAAGVALGARIGQLRQELDQLTNFENVIISVSQLMETEISGAISSAVTGLVSGSQTIKETLSQMFSNIGQAFLKMAADIISKQLVMITLQTILKALGAVAGGGGGGGGGDLDLSGFRQYSMEGAGMPFAAPFANGGVMTGRGPVPLKKYARGGVANRPQLALYGEGSKPEAYVPLPDGRRIPVALQGQDKMREVMGAGPTQGSGAPVLNMSFQSTNIGGVEYVSRDQLEAAMAETRRAASRDGAKRGMTMTLDRLQQSPSTRTRVGLR